MADFAGDRFLVVRVGNITCAVESRAIREVLPVPPTTRIPGAPEAVRGVMNVRGTLVTLADGRTVLGQDLAAGQGSVVLVDVRGQLAGLVVDEVVDMIAVQPEALAERAELPGVESEFVRAVGRHGDLSFILLDIEALFNPILHL